MMVVGMARGVGGVASGWSVLSLFTAGLQEED